MATQKTSPRKKSDLPVSRASARRGTTKSAESQISEMKAHNFRRQNVKAPKSFFGRAFEAFANVGAIFHPASNAAKK